MGKQILDKKGGTVIYAFFAALTGTAGAAVILYALSLPARFETLSIGDRCLFPWFLAGSFFGFLLLQSIAVGLTAAAIEKRPTNFLPHISAPVTAAASMFIGNAFMGRSPLPEALLSALFYISALALFRARGKKRGKTACVLYASAPGMLLVFIVFALCAMSARGASLYAVSEYVAQIKTELGKISVETAQRYKELLGSGEDLVARLLSEGLIGQAAAKSAQNDLAALLDAVYAAFLRIVPAFGAMMMNIYGFFAASVCNRGAAFDKKRGKEHWFLSISGFGTFIFIVTTFITSIFVSLAEAGTAGLTAIYLRLIFTPAMLGIGVRTLTKLRFDQIRRHLFLTAIAAVLIFLSPVTAISMIGAYGNLAQRAAGRLARIRGEGGEGEDDKKN